MCLYAKRKINTIYANHRRSPLVQHSEIIRRPDTKSRNSRHPIEGCNHSGHPSKFTLFRRFMIRGGKSTTNFRKRIRNQPCVHGGIPSKEFYLQQPSAARNMGFRRVPQQSAFKKLKLQDIWNHIDQTYELQEAEIIEHTSQSGIATPSLSAATQRSIPQTASGPPRATRS